MARIIANRSQVKKLPVGTMVFESDGALVQKLANQKWIEVFLDYTSADIYSFHARELNLPLEVARRGR